MKFLSRFGVTTLIVGLVLTGLIALMISNAALADQGVNPCTATSHHTLKACDYGVMDDYWLAMAKCDNLPTPEERKACSQPAKEDKKSGAELCKAQFEARPVGK